MQELDWVLDEGISDGTVEVYMFNAGDKPTSREPLDPEIIALGRRVRGMNRLIDTLFPKMNV